MAVSPTRASDEVTLNGRESRPDHRRQAMHVQGYAVALTIKVHAFSRDLKDF